MKQPSWGWSTKFAAANHGPKIDSDLQVPGCAGGEKDARASTRMDVPGASAGRKTESHSGPSAHSEIEWGTIG